MGMVDFPTDNLAHLFYSCKGGKIKPQRTREARRARRGVDWETLRVFKTLRVSKTGMGGRTSRRFDDGKSEGSGKTLRDVWGGARMERSNDDRFDELRKQGDPAVENGRINGRSL